MQARQDLVSDPGFTIVRRSWRLKHQRFAQNDEGDDAATCIILSALDRSCAICIAYSTNIMKGDVVGITQRVFKFLSSSQRFVQGSQLRPSRAFGNFNTEFSRSRTQEREYDFEVSKITNVEIALDKRSP